MLQATLRRTPYGVRYSLLPNALHGKGAHARPNTSVHRHFFNYFLFR